MGLSIWQILIIVGVVVLLFGANRIPRLMRDLGSGVTQFKKGLSDKEGGDGADDEKPVIEAKQAADTVDKTNEKSAST
jgi:sec-independent protein translocase protein TatA